MIRCHIGNNEENQESGHTQDSPCLDSSGSGRQVHVDVNIGIRTTQAPGGRPFDQAQLKQHASILMDSGRVTAQPTGQFPDPHVAPISLKGMDDRPASFSQSSKECSRSFKIQRLALIASRVLQADFQSGFNVMVRLLMAFSGGQLHQ